MINIEKYGIKEMSFDFDVSKQPSKCRVCDLVIQSGSNRAAIVFHSFWGNSSTKYFLHLECFRSQSSNDINDCQSCGSPDFYGFAHSKKLHDKICKICILDSKIGMCSCCGKFYDKSKLSRASNTSTETVFMSSTSEMVNAFIYYCIKCESMYSLTSERSLKKQEKDDKVIINKLKSIKSEVENWNDEI